MNAAGGRLGKAVTLIAIVAALSTGWVSHVLAAHPTAGNLAFQELWDHTDRPVYEERVARNFVWGPAPLTNIAEEPFENPLGPFRQVQYFEKGRMEFVVHEEVDYTSSFYALSGSIIRELVTGQIAIGFDSYESRGAATLSIAGDENDTTGPSYASFSNLLWAEPLSSGSMVTQTISRDGSVTDNPDLAQYDVTAAHLIDLPGLRHQIASPFWNYLNASGEVWLNDHFGQGRLFDDWLQVIGLPLTEAYWAEVMIDGSYKDVLIQLFERRVLTYIPTFPAEWQVGHANAGLHYVEWRYGPDFATLPLFNQPPPAPPEPPKLPPPDLTQLEQDLRALESQWEGDQAITITDLQTGEFISINGDQTHYAACSIKVFIMIAIAQDIEAGKYTAASVEYLVLPAMGPSAVWPARELIRIVGDGDIGRGLQRVNEIMWELGAKKSIMTHPPGYYGEEYGYLASHGEVENLLTTDDLNVMLGNLYFGGILSPEMTGYVLWSMTIATPFLNGSLGGPLPPEATLYHKIGLIYEPLNVWNDTGIVVFDRGGEQYAYAISYLSSNNSTGYIDEYWRAYTVSEMAWATFSALPGQ